MAPFDHVDASEDHAGKPVPKEGTEDQPQDLAEESQPVVATLSSGSSVSVGDVGASVVADAALVLATTDASNIPAVPVVINLRTSVNLRTSFVVNVSVAADGAAIEFSVES